MLSNILMTLGGVACTVAIVGLVVLVAMHREPALFVAPCCLASILCCTLGVLAAAVE